MLEIDSILPIQTYHIFYKNKQLKQLTASTPVKLKLAIKEHVNPPKKNKKVFIIRIKINSDNSNRKIIISCDQYTITTELGLIVEKGDYGISVIYSDNDLEKYGFKLTHIKKIIKVLETKTVNLSKNFINISEILG